MLFVTLLRLNVLFDDGPFSQLQATLEWPLHAFVATPSGFEMATAAFTKLWSEVPNEVVDLNIRLCQLVFCEFSGVGHCVGNVVLPSSGYDTEGRWRIVSYGLPTTVLDVYITGLINHTGFNNIMTSSNTRVYAASMTRG